VKCIHKNLLKEKNEYENKIVAMKDKTDKEIKNLIDEKNNL
jgi:hypothetical protein